MFSTAVIIYLFLGGAGAGACVVLAVLGLATPKEAVAFHVAVSAHVPFRASSENILRTRTEAVIPDALRRLLAPGYAAAFMALLLGILFLAQDLGRMDRLLMLLVTPRLSWVSVGAYALVVELLLAVVLALLSARILRRWPYRVLRGLQVASAAVGLLVMLYTGMLLAGMPSVPVWNVAATPALFVLSAASCGVALVALGARAAGAEARFPRVMRRLFAWDAALIVAEAAALVALLVSVPHVWPPDTQTGLAAAASIRALLRGELSQAFWVGYVTIGLAVPLVLDVVVAGFRDAMGPRSVVPELAAAACVLVGGFIMRWCIVMAGMQPTLAMM